MLAHQPAARFSILPRPTLRSLTSAYLVRIYIGTALMLALWATGTVAQAASPSPHTNNRVNSNAVLIASNYRIDILTQAIEQHPDNAALYNSRGWYNFLDGNYAETVADYSRVIELGIKNIDPVYHTSVYHVRGLAYAELDEKSLAIESLQIAADMYATEGNSAAVQELNAAIAQLSE